MTASNLTSPEGKSGDFDRKKKVTSAKELRTAASMFTAVGFSIDAVWHHYLRQFYIGPPRALHTAGFYAFWAGIGYCTFRSGDWTHAAIARDRNGIPTAPLPEYDGVWDQGATSAVAQAKSVPLRRQRAHWLANASLIQVPVLARLTYVYLPWFWQRSLTHRVVWCGTAVYTSLFSVRSAQIMSESRSKVWEEQEQGKTS